MNKIIKNLIPEYLLNLRQFYVAFKSNEKLKHEKLLLQKRQASIIKSVIASGSPIKLEIGSGPKAGINGWLTLDLHAGCDLQINLLERIPFPDNSVDMIYSSHFLEHFQTNEIKLLLRECYRILKPGGIISACVPDSSTYILAYTNNTQLDPQIWLRYLPAADINSKIDYVNYIGHLNGEHKHLFDLENLIAIHKNCGFDNIKKRNFNPELDMEVRDYQSIYIEAVK